MANLFNQKRLKLVKGTRLVSFLFIASSVLIAAGFLFAANIYYNIDTGEVIMEEIQRVTNVLRATGGAIVGGSATQNPTSGYSFEVVGKTKLATTTLEGYLIGIHSSEAPIRFATSSGGDYVGFKAPSALTTTTVYTWPTDYPAGSGYLLQSDTSGNLSWVSPGTAGVGDITAVGDCGSGECFTADGSGNALYFEGATNDDYEIILTAADPGQDYTITLPAANGTVALGTSTAGYVAYWSGTNTLAGEQYLSTSRGGIGEDSSAWSGMVRVVSGDWGTITGTAGYVAYWSDANTISAEQYLATSRGGLGGDVTAAGAGEILYSTGANTYDSLPAGTANQILTSGGAAAPSWKNIADLITVTNGLTESGTTDLTIKLGGALGEDTTISLGNYNMIYNLTGTGDFKIQDNGTDIFVVSDDGKIYYKSYPLAESGKQVLREMIPVFGFDLPAQTATTSYVQISRTIQDYPFSTVSPGATRVHKFIIRIAASTTTATTTWRVYNETDATTTATFDLALDQSTDLDKGEVYISSNVNIPTDTDDWRLDMKTNGNTVRVYQVFLAAYDEMQ